MTEKPTGLDELGSVLKPLIMALRLAVGKVSMTGTYDVTNSNIEKHETQGCSNFEAVYSTAQVLRKSSSKGIANMGLCIKKYHNSLILISTYFQNFKI